MDALAGDRKEQAPLQTKLLEINLVTNPPVADAILGQGTLTHYDKPKIAQLCEKAGLYLQALRHYSNIADLKRVIVNTHAIEPQVRRLRNTKSNYKRSSFGCRQFCVSSITS